MEGPPLGPGGEDITWPDQVAPRGRKASSTRKIKPQTSNLHALILILFYLHTSGLGYPGLNVFQQTKAFHLQKQAAGNPTPAASSRRGKNTVLKSL